MPVAARPTTPAGSVTATAAAPIRLIVPVSHGLVIMKNTHLRAAGPSTTVDSATRSVA
jgi:hypothetical protein